LRSLGVSEILGHDEGGLISCHSLHSIGLFAKKLFGSASACSSDELIVEQIERLLLG